MKKKINNKITNIVTLSLVVIVVFLAISANALPWGDIFPNNDNLMFYYDFEESSGDVVNRLNSSINNGTIVNSPTRGVPGIIGNGIRFDGDDGTMDIVNITSLLNPGTTLTHWSIGVWINSTAKSDGDAVGGGSTFGNLLVEDGAGTLVASVTTCGDLSISAADYQPRFWSFVVITGNETGCFLYHNGTLSASNTANGSLEANQAIVIGAAAFGGLSGQWNGTIDEFFFINHSSISAEQVSDLYNDGAGTAFQGERRPTDNEITSDTSIFFDISFDLGSLDESKNATLYLWHLNNSVYRTSTKNLSENATKTVQIQVVDIDSNEYLWNVLLVSVNQTSDLNYLLAGENFTLTIGAEEIASAFSATTFETESEFFETNITIPNTTTISSVNFVYNFTDITTVTPILIAGNNYSLQRTRDIPVGTGANTFYFNISYSNGFVQELSSHDQNVNLINFSLCGSAPQDIPYLNFTYRNETPSQERINASVSESTFTYTLGDLSTNKTFSFSTSTESAFHSFCFNLPHKTISSNVFYSYTNSKSQQRTYNPDTLTLSNSTTNTDLFLLPTDEGIFVTFQVLNSANQPIEGAEVTLERSGFGIISQSTTPASGTVSIFLNPNLVYTLTVQKSGFQTFTTTQSFSDSQYTVVLGGGTESNFTDYTRGISVEVKPPLGVLANSTDIQFNFTLNSTFYDLDEFGFSLHNRTDPTVVFRSNSSTATAGGILTATINTGNNGTIQMDYYWIVDGVTNNRTLVWSVGSFPGSEFSLFHFFTDLSLFASQGIFGLNDFSLNIIIFVVLLMGTGLLSLKFGITSPGILMGFLTSFVYLLEVAFDLIPTLAFEGSLFTLCLFISITMIIREAMR